LLEQGLWGTVDSSTVQERVYGKGKIIWGKTVRDVLLQRGITPDVQLKATLPTRLITYTAVQQTRISILSGIKSQKALQVPAPSV
jgi:hypothetical protein